MEIKARNAGLGAFSHWRRPPGKWVSILTDPGYRACYSSTRSPQEGKAGMTYDAETFALNTANILLGIFALLSVVAVACGVLHEIFTRVKRTQRARNMLLHRRTRKRSPVSDTGLRNAARKSGQSVRPVLHHQIPRPRSRPCGGRGDRPEPARSHPSYERAGQGHCRFRYGCLVPKKGREKPRAPYRRAGEAAHPPQQATLLLVEDEDSLRQPIAKMLRRRGFEVLEARMGLPRSICCARMPAASMRCCWT